MLCKFEYITDKNVCSTKDTFGEPRDKPAWEKILKPIKLTTDKDPDSIKKFCESK